MTFEFLQPRQTTWRSMRTPGALRRNPERSSRPHTRSRTLVDGPPSPTPEDEPEDKFSLVRKSRYFEEYDEPVSHIIYGLHVMSPFTFHQILLIYSKLTHFLSCAAPSSFLQRFQGPPSCSEACGWNHRVRTGEHLQQRAGESVQQLHRRFHSHWNAEKVYSFWLLSSFSWRH